LLIFKNQKPIPRRFIQHFHLFNHKINKQPLFFFTRSFKAKQYYNSLKKNENVSKPRHTFFSSNFHLSNLEKGNALNQNSFSFLNLNKNKPIKDSWLRTFFLRKFLKKKKILSRKKKTKKNYFFCKIILIFHVANCLKKKKK